LPRDVGASLNQFTSDSHSLGIAAGYGLDGRNSTPGRGKKIFDYSTMSKLAPGPTQRPIRWVLGVQLPGSKGDHSPPSSDEIQEQIYLYLAVSSLRRGRTFLSSHVLLLVTTGMDAVSPHIKQLGRKADNSPQSSAEVKNGGVTPPLPHTST
jgi:hypothetical protein